MHVVLVAVDVVEDTPTDVGIGGAMENWHGEGVCGATGVAM